MDLGGPEVVILLGAVVLVFAVVAFWALSAAGGRVRDATRTVDVPPQEWLQSLASAVGTSPRHQIASGGPGVMTITRQRIPAWAILLAVLLFPIGLIALVARTPETGTITARDLRDGRTEVHMTGVFSNDLVDRVNAVL